MCKGESKGSKTPSCTATIWWDNAARMERWSRQAWAGNEKERGKEEEEGFDPNAGLNDLT
jgi:hypothetical protein